MSKGVMLKCRGRGSTCYLKFPAIFRCSSSPHGSSQKVFLKDFSLLGDELSGPEPARHLSSRLTWVWNWCRWLTVIPRLNVQLIHGQNGRLLVGASFMSSATSYHQTTLTQTFWPLDEPSLQWLHSQSDKNKNHQRPLESRLSLT